MTLCCALFGNVGTGLATTSSSYPNVVFSDGFESGSLSAWNNAAGAGTGSATVSASAAHTGSYGAQITNSSGQYELIAKTFSRPLPDSATVFWVHVAPGGGWQTLAEARDANSQYAWAMLYDGSGQAIDFYAFNGSGASTEIYTGAGSAPNNAWLKIEVDYTATSSGGAQLYINGQTHPSWGVSGDYTRTANYQTLQLWDDTTATTDFDDVQVATPPAATPSAPTAVQGTAAPSAVNLSWTAPSSDGGSAITGYRITPYIGGTAQTAILTNSTATSYSVSGLQSGTAYTFTVAAINGAGTGPDSAASAPVTPIAPGPPGAPTGVQGAPSDSMVTLTWTAPSSDGGSSITGYRVTPYIGATAQTPILTKSTSTTYAVTGLTNGTSYTFTVAAINANGTGPDSAASAAVKPIGAPTNYTNTVFSDGFESGSLSAWNNSAGAGTGSATVTAGSAHSGSYGAQITNTASGQYELIAKTFSQPLADSSTIFWVRVGSGGGMQSLAQGRDQSSQPVWALLYDGTHQGLYFYPYRGTAGSTEIYTGAGSVPTNTWVKIQVVYTATSSGGAQLYINGQTNPSWGVSGDYTRAANYQTLQLWNDQTDTTAFDDVQVASPPPTAPFAPSGVQGTARDKAANLSWTAPYNGGSAITGYRVTPYVNGTPQTPIMTSSTATSYLVSGLTDGTAYTFTVAAINAVGTSPESAVSAAVTPAPPVPPPAPTAVQGLPDDSAVNLTWTAPTSDGGAPITGYQVTPYINGTAQTPIMTNSPAPGYYVSGLTNGVAYTFTVAAVNSAGTGAASAPSAPVTPVASNSPYTNVVFQDGFESGSLNAWSNPSGSGSITVTPAAAHSGTYGARIANTGAQYGLLIKNLQPMTDFSTTFWVRVAPGGGLQSLAQVRDASSQVVWALLYDGNNQGIYFYPYNGSGTSTPIYTGNGSVPANLWTKVEVQFTATTSGGAKLYVDGQTQPTWAVSGNYSRSSNATQLQLWNDQPDTTDFDDVKIATPGSATTAPGAPTAVQGIPQDGAVNLSWTSPTTGGGAITSYRITPYIGTVAQTPITTGSAATNQRVTGLTNGAVYTFTVAAVNGVGTGPDSLGSAPVQPAALNPVQLENAQAGDPNWNNVTEPPDPTYISGYGSQTSVNHGQSIDLYVTTTASNVAIDIYRMGWYNGAGARLMQSMGTFPGVNQPQAQPNSTTGMVAESWTKTATLNVPASWTTGVYLARLTASNGYGSWIRFIVRDDGGHEPILFQSSTNTDEAYNTYGGTSLYNNINSPTWPAATYPHAMKVSFDRPDANGDGTGRFLSWEYPMVQWLEKNGYNVAYDTDTDTGGATNPLLNHQAFLVVGHDEYWSKGMRDNVQAAIAAGVNVGFFAGNESYWQVRYEASAAGAANRVMVGYKDQAELSGNGGPDPMFNVNNSLLTSTFRDPLVNNPEDSMMGVMFGGETVNSPYIVSNASNWVFTGTGWTNGTSIPGIVGYEYDHYFGDSTTPPGTVVLSNTPLTNTENNQPDTANSTIYKAPSGARVFAAGTIQWSYGLDGSSFVDPGIQRVTANVLAAFTGIWNPPGG